MNILHVTEDNSKSNFGITAVVNDLNDKLNANNINSKVVNDGFKDNKGTHNSGRSSKWDVKVNDNAVVFENLKVDKYIIYCWKKYHDISWFTKIGYFLRKNGGYKLVKNILKRINR